MCIFVLSNWKNAPNILILFLILHYDEQVTSPEFTVIICGVKLAPTEQDSQSPTERKIENY